jgi:hypothetical protein
MTYSPGSNIEANDYNSFATLTGGMNQVYSDLTPGTFALPDASYGYGQSPSLLPVTSGEEIRSSHTGNLFNVMRKCGVHQGTPVVPPLPGTPHYSNSNPGLNDIIVPYSGIETLVSTLGNNRFNLAPGNSTMIIGNTFTQGAATKGWVNTLTFNYQVNFGSWNNARYFFNSGGKLQLNGSYTPMPAPHVVTADEHQFSSVLSRMSPLVFKHSDTTPYTGNGATSIGFYNTSNPAAWSTLTTTPQVIYHGTRGGGYYYAAGYIEVTAKLNATAGTNGKIDFAITLVDQDPVPMIAPKTGTTTYRVDIIKATGSAVSYPGIHSVSSVGPYGGFAKA